MQLPPTPASLGSKLIEKGLGRKRNKVCVPVGQVGSGKATHPSASHSTWVTSSSPLPILLQPLSVAVCQSRTVRTGDMSKPAQAAPRLCSGHGVHPAAPDMQLGQHRAGGSSPSRQTGPAVTVHQRVAPPLSFRGTGTPSGAPSSPSPRPAGHPEPWASHSARTLAWALLQTQGTVKFHSGHCGSL